MKKIYFLALLFTSIVSAQVNVGITGNVDGVYINEVHYDNTGGDVGEFIEVAGPAGTDLSTYFITLYNGNGGVPYGEGMTNPLQLSGTIDDEGTGVGAVVFFISGIQNGAPDGFALSNGGTDIQFLSYEGSFMAVGGAADGLTSEDIGVSEDGTDPAGSSLEYDEAGMFWAAASDDTPGDYGAVLSVVQNDIEGFSLYPNPVTNGKVTITTAKNLTKLVAVYDVLGKEVLNKTLTETTLDVSALNSGIYILKAIEDSKITVQKLIIK